MKTSERLQKKDRKIEKNRRYAIPIKITHVAVTRCQDRNIKQKAAKSAKQAKSTTIRNNNRRYYYLVYLIMMRVKNHQIAPTILVEAA
jgi:hypothetical protein